MILLNFYEIIDIIFMTVIIGLIFMDFFKIKTPNTRKPWNNVITQKGFNKQAFLTSIIIIAPAIILHEFGHKFVAMSFGLTATFNAAYGWLIFALILKFIIPGFIFLVPAYVSISEGATYLQHSIVAFAGPLVNLIIFGAIALFFIYAKSKKLQIKRKTMMILLFTKKVNLFLFIFNMLPIPGFDGFHIFSGLIKAFL